MKKFLSLISVLVLFIPSNNFAQIIMEENFNYPVGLLYQNSGGLWKRTTNNDMAIISGNLSYTGYSNPGIGNYLYSEGSSSKGTISRFIGASLKNEVYVSFILMLKDTLNLAAPDYPGSSFFYLQSSSGTAKVFVYIKKSMSSGTFKLGIYKSSSTKIIFSDTECPILTPHLIIIKYSFKSGSNDDLVNLWINPSINDSEPLPLLTTGTNESDFDHIDSISFKQSSLGGNFFVDAIRVFTRWADAPLPVELSSFSASVKNKGVILNWKTETEVDNYGFDVERKIGKDNAEWTKLGFIPGHGNSNSPHSYSFEDKRISSSSIYFYRLKQIDNDGTFKYSDEIETDVNISGDFQLYQNYPNPFNPETKIKFFIPEEGETTLSLYNAIGQKISTLLQDNLSPGDHEISFDGSILNSGIYFCVLESGGKRKTIKLTFMK